MGAQPAFRQALIDGDLRRLRRIWETQFPHLPQPQNTEQAEICLHIARTATNTIPFKLRAWSHRWLIERELPSQLPEWLKPKAEREYPKQAEGVGFAWGCSVKALRPLTPHIEDEVGRRINELLAEKADPAFIRAEIVSTKNQTLKKLIGVVDPKETLK